MLERAEIIVPNEGRNENMGVVVDAWTLTRRWIRRRAVDRALNVTKMIEGALGFIIIE